MNTINERQEEFIYNEILGEPIIGIHIDKHDSEVKIILRGGKHILITGGSINGYNNLTLEFNNKDGMTLCSIEVES